MAVNSRISIFKMVEPYYVSWRKIVRLLLNFSTTTHCNENDQKIACSLLLMLTVNYFIFYIFVYLLSEQVCLLGHSLQILIKYSLNEQQTCVDHSSVWKHLLLFTSC